MGKVMRHTLGASLNIRHNLSSSKGPKPLQLKLLTTYIPKTSAFTDRKSGSAGMPRPISYAVFCLKKKTVAEKILRVNESLGGISRLTFQMTVAALPHAKLLRAIELLGTRVAPLVRTALASETTAVPSLANAHAA